MVERRGGKWGSALVVKSEGVGLIRGEGVFDGHF